MGLDNIEAMITIPKGEEYRFRETILCLNGKVGVAEACDETRQVYRFRYPAEEPSKILWVHARFLQFLEKERVSPISKEDIEELCRK